MTNEEKVKAMAEEATLFRAASSFASTSIIYAGDDYMLIEDEEVGKPDVKVMYQDVDLNKDMFFAAIVMKVPA